MIKNLIDIAKEFLGVVFGAIALLAITCAILFGIGFGIYSIFEAAKSPEQKAKEQAQEIAERTPHVYSKIDGCTVYVWKNGNYNSYFTKCDNTNKVVTEFSHGESCGKACTKKVTETVETN